MRQFHDIGQAANVGFVGSLAHQFLAGNYTRHGESEYGVLQDWWHIYLALSHGYIWAIYGENIGLIIRHGCWVAGLDRN